MFKYNNFSILTENVEQSKSYLRKNNIPETDPLYLGIRELTKGKDGYVGWITKLGYEDLKGYDTKTRLNSISTLLKLITDNQNIIELMDKPVIQYNTIEEFQDGFEKSKLLFKSKKIYNDFPKRQKDLLNINDRNTISLLSKLYDDKTKNVFIRKISSYKTKDDLISSLKRFLEGGSLNNDFDEILNNLEAYKLPLIYADETNGLIIARILNYSQCKTVGSKTSWCIARSEQTFNNYVNPNSFDRQYIIYLTDLPVTNDDRIIGATYNIDGFYTAHNVIDSGVYEDELQKILKDRDYDINHLKINKNNITQEDIDKSDFSLLKRIMTYDDILKLKNRYKETDLKKIKEEDIIKYNIEDKKELKYDDLKKFNREDFFSKNVLGRLIPNDKITIFDFIKCGLTKDDIIKNKKLILTKIIDEKEIEDFNEILKLKYDESNFKNYKYGGYYSRRYDLDKTILTLKFYNKTKENGVTLNDLEKVLFVTYSHEFEIVKKYLKEQKYDTELSNKNIMFDFFEKIYIKGHFNDTIDMFVYLNGIGYKYPDKIKEWFFGKNPSEDVYRYSEYIIPEYKLKSYKELFSKDIETYNKIEKYNKINIFKRICLHLSGVGVGLDYRDYKSVTMDDWIRDWMDVGLDAYDYKTVSGYSLSYDWIISYVILLVYNNKFDLLNKMKMNWTLGKGSSNISENSLLYKLVGTIMDLRWSNSARKIPLVESITETQRYKISEWIIYTVFDSFNNEDKDKLEYSIQLLYFAYDRIKMNEYIDKIKKDNSDDRLKRLEPLIIYLIDKKFEKTSYYKTDRFDKHIDLKYILNRFSSDNKITLGDNKIMSYNANYIADAQSSEMIKNHFTVEPKPRSSGWESKVYNYRNFINEKINR